MQKFNFMQKETWNQLIAKLNRMFNQKADKSELPTVPSKLPNPYALNFVGPVESVNYDGSEERSVNLASFAATEVVYSLEERRIGYWIDGKPLYEKTIDFGSLPDTTTKEVPHGIENADIFFVFSGYVYDSISKQCFGVVWANTSISNNSYNFFCTSTKIICESKSNRTNQIAFVKVRYTKTTD